jgi:hypothetical protein
MDLKMQQELVQSCGTITAFNYAYCKIIHDQLFWLLKSDIVDKNGEEFVIFRVSTGQWVANYKKKLEATEQAIENFDPDVSYEQTQTKGISDSRKIINASCIIMKEDSLIPALVEHLSEQTKIKDCICFPPPSGYCKLEEVLKFSDGINLFYRQVKEFLAMFEEGK